MGARHLATTDHVIFVKAYLKCGIANALDETKVDFIWSEHDRQTDSPRTLINKAKPSTSAGAKILCPIPIETVTLGTMIATMMFTMM